MTANDVKNMEKAAAEAIRKLRLEKLNSGHPFLIFAEELPAGQSYLEYPDGTIHIVAIDENSRKFITVKKLSTKASTNIRRQHHLTEYA